MRGSLTGKEILVIDDAKDVRLLTQKILEGDGAKVSAVESVAAGTDLVSKRAPHLILTDLSIPWVSGFDFLRLRREDPALRDIPAIVLSGLRDRASVVEAVALGASDYLLKPIQASLLLQKVRKSLRSRAFLAHRFSPADRPKASVSLAAEIQHAGEYGLQLDSPVRLSPDETVKLSGELLEKLGQADVLLRSAQTPEPASVRGRYVCELNLVGLDEAAARDLRARLKEIR